MERVVHPEAGTNKYLGQKTSERDDVQCTPSQSFGDKFDHRQSGETDTSSRCSSCNRSRNTSTTSVSREVSSNDGTIVAGVDVVFPFQIFLLGRFRRAPFCNEPCPAVVVVFGNHPCFALSEDRRFDPVSRHQVVRLWLMFCFFVVLWHTAEEDVAFNVVVAFFLLVWVLELD